MILFKYLSFDFIILAFNFLGRIRASIVYLRDNRQIKCILPTCTKYRYFLEKENFGLFFLFEINLLKGFIVQKYSPDVDLYALHKLSRYDAV